MVRSLNLRDVDEALIARLERRAARHGRSVEAEHRAILEQALSAEPDANFSFEERAAELRKRTEGRKQTPSEVLQREGRNER